MQEETSEQALQIEAAQEFKAQLQQLQDTIKKQVPFEPYSTLLGMLIHIMILPHLNESSFPGQGCNVQASAEAFTYRRQHLIASIITLVPWCMQ